MEEGNNKKTKDFNKYLKKTFEWKDNEDHIIKNKKIKTLFLTITFELDYEKMKDDNIVDHAKYKNVTLLDLDTEFEIKIA